MKLEEDFRILVDFYVQNNEKLSSKRLVNSMKPCEMSWASLMSEGIVENGKHL